MFVQRLQRVGDAYIIIIPAEAIEQLGFQPNETVEIELTKLNDYHVRDDVATATKRAFEHYAADLDNLKEHGD